MSAGSGGFGMTFTDSSTTLKPPSANGHAPTSDTIPGQTPTERSVNFKRGRPKTRGPNYAQIHSKPLPLEIYPLPAFHPSHPISLIRLAYVYLSQLLSPPSSHPTSTYLGYFSPQTRSVHVTDPVHIRALWEMGFFGKGTLSRSEPSWLEREKARISAEKGGHGKKTAEEVTKARREERRLFKLERARLEREQIEKQRLVEEGKIVAEDAPASCPSIDHEANKEANEELVDGDSSEINLLDPNGYLEKPASNVRADVEHVGRVSDAELITLTSKDSEIERTAETGVTRQSAPFAGVSEWDQREDQFEFTNEEHLQLTLEEAFFLSYALGVLAIELSSTMMTDPLHPRNHLSNLRLFAAHSSFPPLAPDTPLAPDNPFLLNYATYHHFRSLGWVVRPGVKFGVDYLLYNRGPVFSHAEFGVVIIPAYTHAYWKAQSGSARRRIKEERDWWALHCVNRVQSQVHKTLVLVYVDVPPPQDWRGYSGEDLDVGSLLRRYKIREFIIRRWLANRSRD